MIISASRRTDIPAFFSQWFMGRVAEGLVMVRNPMNRAQVSRVRLDREAVDCIVFWTKNPAPMLDKLESLAGYAYYFLFTITGYGKELERNVPPLDERLQTFANLAAMIGKERVIWRYDPILLTEEMDEDFHYKNFESISKVLQGHTVTCITSFLDMYNKCKRNLAEIPITMPGPGQMLEMINRLNQIADSNGIKLYTCAEALDFSQVCSGPARCIDPVLVAHLTGSYRLIPKDKNQRKSCGCVESIDIGGYDTCAHHCLYCYANSNSSQVAKNLARHNPRSPLLTGELTGTETITDREIKTYPPTPRTLF